MPTIVRAKVAPTPRNPFSFDAALESFADGALAVEDGRILAWAAYPEVLASVPDSSVVDAPDSVLLPGFVDCHVHYPQIRMIGAMGLALQDWLPLRAPPEEARLSDQAYACWLPERFLRALALNGTTTALSRA